VLGGGGDIIVIFTGEAQFCAVTLVHDVPQLFGGQGLKTDRIHLNQLRSRFMFPFSVMVQIQMFSIQQSETSY